MTNEIYQGTMDGSEKMWLITGVRYRDVKLRMEKFLSELKPGTEVEIIASLCEEGAFRNLGAYMTWCGEYLNVGVLSAAMRDEAATYLDEDGFMTVRVVKVGDKDFWVAPTADAPCRQQPQRRGIEALPFEQTLVPFRTTADARRLSATNQLNSQLRLVLSLVDGGDRLELRQQSDRLLALLRGYPEHCLHSLCVEEARTLHSIIGQVQRLRDELMGQKGMADIVYQIGDQCGVLEELEHEYSKTHVCARIYNEELQELTRMAQQPKGALEQFFVQEGLANNGEEPTQEQFRAVKNRLNQWLSGFMNGWYSRTKRDLESLASTLKCEYLTRHDLYAYYTCEILIRAIDEALKAGTQPVGDGREASAEECDPYHILPENLSKRSIRDAAIAAEAVIQGEPYKYAHLMKVMMDHRVTILSQSEQADFAKTLEAWQLGGGREAEKLKNSIRQRLGKMMQNRGIATGRALPLYKTWPANDPDRLICEQIAPFFERAGFGYPRTT